MSPIYSLDLFLNVQNAFSIIGRSRKFSSAVSIFLYLLYFFSLSTNVSSDEKFVVYIRSRNDNQPLKFISYCFNCPSPETEGSVVIGINPKYGIQEYIISGEVIYCVPNFAQNSVINNSHHLSNRIVFIDRGEISFLDKILRVQEQTQAVGVIIADNGDCDDTFQYCKSKIGTVRDGGFAAFDEASLWLQVQIPVVLISFNSAEKLRKLMRIERILIPSLGYQNVSVNSLNNHQDLHDHDQEYHEGLNEIDEYQNQFLDNSYDDFPFDEL
jgi:hypothetical protein